MAEGFQLVRVEIIRSDGTSGAGKAWECCACGFLIGCHASDVINLNRPPPECLICDSTPIVHGSDPQSRH